MNSIQTKLTNKRNKTIEEKCNITNNIYKEKDFSISLYKIKNSYIQENKSKPADKTIEKYNEIFYMN